MNKIYLSGIVAEPPSRLGQEGAPEHVRFHLWVSHKSKQGALKRERYPIHGWNGAAAWALANLRQGQRVMVQGYLTQRSLPLPGEGTVTVNEVTAEEFFAGIEAGDRETGPEEKPAGEAQGNGEDRRAENGGLVGNQGLTENQGFTERKDQE